MAVWDIFFDFCSLLYWGGGEEEGTILRVPSAAILNLWVVTTPLGSDDPFQGSTKTTGNNRYLHGDSYITVAELQLRSSNKSNYYGREVFTP